MEDPRCCGTGTCIINAEGQCWCGQTWDGERMCFPPPPTAIAKPSTDPFTDPSTELSTDPDRPVA